MRLIRAEIEDASGLALKGLVPCDGLTVLIGANGSGKSRTLEYVESLLADGMEFRGRQSRLAPEPHWAYGWVHVALHRLQEIDGDWPWFRSLLESLRWDAELGEREDELNRLTRAWHAPDEPVLLGRSWEYFDTEDDYLEAFEMTLEDDRSFISFASRLKDH